MRLPEDAGEGDHIDHISFGKISWLDGSGSWEGQSRSSRSGSRRKRREASGDLLQFRHTGPDRSGQRRPGRPVGHVVEGHQRAANDPVVIDVVLHQE